MIKYRTLKRDEVQALLPQHEIRRLATMMISVLIFQRDSMVECGHKFVARTSVVKRKNADQNKPLKCVVKEYSFAEALEMTGGNMTETAKLLGVSRKTLYRRIASGDIK